MKTTTTRCVLALSAVLLFVFPEIPLRAQIGGAGEIKGTITDSSGALLPDTTVVALNAATGVETRTSTTAAGLYVLSPLAPGDYSVTVSHDGFQTLVQQHVNVDALTVVGLNLTLNVGANTQSVTVSAAPPAIDTTDATLGITIDNSEYTALPLAMGGGPLAADGFITLLPGVQAFPLAGAGFTINGGESYTNAIYINGLPTVNNQGGGMDQSLDLGFAVDALDQFQINTNGTPAMYQGQGVENFHIKSGTNQMHGDVYEYVRNTVFDAAGFFNTKTPIEKQNEFGVTIGGPILKNRLFYFGNYDGYRLRQQAQFAYNTIPTIAEQNGDFSAFPTPIYDPATTVCNAGSCTRQQFSYNGVLNVIPPDRISSISKFLQSKLPTPINNNLQNNYLGGLQPSTNQDRYLIKVDANLTPNDKVYGFGNWGDYRNPTLPPGATNLPLPYSSSRYTIQTAYTDGLGYTRVLSPHLVNDFTAEYIRLIQGAVAPTVGGNWANKAGLTGLPSGDPQDTFPAISFSGPDSPTPWAVNANTSEYKHTNNTYGLGDTIQWSHGRHSFNFGTQISFEQVGQILPSSLPIVAFSNTQTAGFTSNGTLDNTTGNGYASFLLGEVNVTALNASADNLTAVEFSNHSYSFFAQDDMRVTRRLTLNMGLRYDIYTPMVEQLNRESWLDPQLPNPAIGGYPGALQFAGYGPDSCHCRAPVSTTFRNLGPRLGFAYALEQKTVLRGGYGMFFIPSGVQGGSGQTLGTQQLGYQAQPLFQSPNGIDAAFNWNTGFPSYVHAPFIDPTLNTGFNTANPGSGSITSFGEPSHAARGPYFQDWSFTVEKELLPSVVVNVSYSGSVGHFLPTAIGTGIYSNEIRPQYLALGNLLYAPATPANIAAAQGIIPGVSLPYPTFAGTIVQMLRPFPQYGGIFDIYPNVGNSSYNSLQVSAQKRFSHGLSFLLSYTHGKEIDTSGSNNDLANAFFFTPGRDAYNAGLDRSLDMADIPNTVVLSYVYNLPFGAGHSFGSGNAVVRALVSHWQLAAIHTYRQGIPLGPFTASCNAPGTGACYADYNPSFSGDVRLNGQYGNGYVKGSLRPYINVTAFENPAPYTLGNTPRTAPYGLRNPPFLNEDVSVARDVRLWERVTLHLQASAFNVFNRTELGGINTDITSTSFGTISGQVNGARNLQFNAKVSF